MMYTDKEKYGVTSELISSYAWDTALNFICQNSEHGYILATATSTTYGNIGTGGTGIKQTGGTPADCYSNIYDLVGNCKEWTTEYSSETYGSSNYPCVYRGGSYFDNDYYAANRNSDTQVCSRIGFSFRLSLYV